MLYKEFIIKDKEYKAVLNASASVQAEEKLGENPLNILIEISENENRIPELKKLLVILHASLQKYQHGITFADTYDLYDDFIEDGHQMADLIPIIVDIFEVSGYFKREEEDKPKNGSKGKK